MQLQQKWLRHLIPVTNKTVNTRKSGKKVKLTSHMSAMVVTVSSALIVVVVDLPSGILLNWPFATWAVLGRL